MRLSDDCRQHALVLLEIAHEAPEFRDRAVALAQMWLTLAVLEDQTTVWEAERKIRECPSLIRERI